MDIPDLLEVECSGKYLPSDVDLTFIKLFNYADGEIISIALFTKGTCETFRKYSSCSIFNADSRNSVVKTLVSDLDRRDITIIGCNISTVTRVGQVFTFTSSVIARKS